MRSLIQMDSNAACKHTDYIKFSMIYETNNAFDSQCQGMRKNAHAAGISSYALYPTAPSVSKFFLKCLQPLLESSKPIICPRFLNTYTTFVASW